jgi:hypothetical protein
MINAIFVSRAGLLEATKRLEATARDIASQGSAAKAVTGPPREGAPVTGATKAPSGSAGDPVGAVFDLMDAEMSFRMNAETMKTAADMVRSLYDALD